MCQEFCFCLPKRCLALIKCLETFSKTIDIRIDKTYPVYNDSKIYKIREAKIEDTDILRTEETSGSFRSFYR